MCPLLSNPGLFCPSQHLLVCFRLRFSLMASACLRWPLLFTRCPSLPVMASAVYSLPLLACHGLCCFFETSASLPCTSLLFCGLCGDYVVSPVQPWSLLGCFLFLLLFRGLCRACYGFFCYRVIPAFLLWPLLFHRGLCLPDGAFMFNHDLYFPALTSAVPSWPLLAGCGLCLPAIASACYPQSLLFFRGLCVPVVTSAVISWPLLACRGLCSFFVASACLLLLLTAPSWPLLASSDHCCSLVASAFLLMPLLSLVASTYLLWPLLFPCGFLMTVGAFAVQ